MSNPFSNQGLLNQPLDHEHCQRILFTALRSARRNGLTPPGTLSYILNELHVLEHYAGQSIYVLHPMEVDQLFSGVTLAIYQAVQKLYVDRLGRSLRMITQVLNRMAAHAGVSLLAPEAIWAIGVFLDERRAEQITINLTRTTNLWVLTSLHLNHCIIRSDGGDHHPTIAVVIDSAQNHVQAYRVTSPGRANTARALVIYDAFTLQRTPAQLVPAGLSWTVPERMCVIGDVPLGLDILCRTLNITLEIADAELPLVRTIESAWDDQHVSLFTEQQFRLTFDTYLYRLHGFGPLRTKRQRDREFAGLLGYNRDPAWQLPALRSLLPIHRMTINNQGEIEFDGLHFQDDLLMLFPNTSVILRQSEQSEATAWIYVDDEILCEAKARELRRADGTYRTYRPVGASRLKG